MKSGNVDAILINMFAEIALDSPVINYMFLVSGTTLWPLVDTPCPINSYCLNGGTCLYYEAVGELVCE
jgi:hypothetical protein